MGETELDVIIPVYRPDERFFRLLAQLACQSIPPHRIILMNTERAYWDAAGAEGRLETIGISERCEIHHLSKAEFDHGGTRNAGVLFSETPYFVMMTQDAVPCDDKLLERLLFPLVNGKAEMSYGRQVASPDADILEKFTRRYNYGDQSFLKTEADKEKLGIKTYFASNVCAAYVRARFDALGGFPPRAIFNEDMIYAARLLQSGGTLAYCADARVYHSHCYTPAQQFHRNFDLAVSQAEHPEIFANLKSEAEGIRMVRRTARFLKRQGEGREIPRLFALSAAKYFGYALGKHYRLLPKWLRARCTMNRSYWEKCA